MKKPNLIIPTSTARHLFSWNMKFPIPDNAALVFPTPNREGTYRFPDNEVYLRIPRISHAEKITVVHSGYPDPNDGLIELFMMLKIIRKYTPKAEVHLILTCFPYARQDKAYYSGELNAAEELITSLVHEHRVRHISVIDAHFANERWTKKHPVTNVSVVDLLMDAARSAHPNSRLVSPDAGSTRRTNIKGATKQRRNSYDVVVSLGGELRDTVKGHVVGAVDDILSTGTTLVRFHKEATKHGARKMLALITHGVNPSGIARIQALYDGLYLSNTIKCAEANVCVAGRVWNIIERSFNGT